MSNQCRDGLCTRPAAEARAEDLKGHRRGFFRSMLSVPMAATGIAVLGEAGARMMRAAPAVAEDERVRRRRAYEIRRDTALFERDQPIQPSVSNGDEQLYARAHYFANYAKGLPHNALGEVESRAYRIYLDALRIGASAAMEAVPAGGVLKLADPQAALAFSLEGLDPHVPFLEPSPAFASAEQAGDVVELYWLALIRDVPFAEYAGSPLIAQAVQELNSLSGYSGSSAGNPVTADNVFRGSTPGDLVGPYVSQFLCKNVPYGLSVVEQKYRTAAPGLDYLTGYSEWLDIQNGAVPTRSAVYQDEFRFLRTGRDLTTWVYTSAFRDS